MRNGAKLATAALAGAVALGIAATSDEAAAEKKEMEKCYGVVKAGHNDCASASGSHSCAGHATEDASGEEWIYLPEGTCERLAGGSTEPK